MSTRFALALLLSVCVFGAASTAGAAGREVTVFAAASLTNALTEIGTLYEAKGHGKAVFSFASSSTLAKQIESGSPADVFISANEEWADHLEKKNLLMPGTRVNLLRNTLVVVAPAEPAPKEMTAITAESLNAVLGKDGRLAVGDPAHVPAGKYAEEALKKLGAWDSLKDRLAPAKDVRAALVLVERGEAPLGIVYATDAAVTKNVKVVATFPADSHAPIVYPAALTGTADKAGGSQFLDFLKTPEARAVFEKHGFTLFQ